MRVKKGLTEFEWDGGNFDKSYGKHGVEQKEAEEVFFDNVALVLPDVEHSQKEERKIIVGRTTKKLMLFVVFTIRGRKIRIISARRMHRKEVQRYEQIKKNTKV